MKCFFKNFLQVFSGNYVEQGRVIRKKTFSAFRKFRISDDKGLIQTQFIQLTDRIPEKNIRNFGVLPFTEFK